MKKATRVDNLTSKLRTLIETQVAMAPTFEHIGGDVPRVALPIYTKEGLAKQFKVADHEVAEALARLNREGLVGQAVHHGSCCGGGGGGRRCYGWRVDTYTARARKVAA